MRTHYLGPVESTIERLHYIQYIHDLHTCTSTHCAYSTVLIVGLVMVERGRRRRGRGRPRLEGGFACSRQMVQRSALHNIQSRNIHTQGFPHTLAKLAICYCILHFGYSKHNIL